MNRRELLAALGGVHPPTYDQRDRVLHLLSRMTFGPTLELYDHVQTIGIDAFINEQLAPELIDESALENRLSIIEVFSQSGEQLYARNRRNNYDFALMNEIRWAFTRRHVLQVSYAQRQLYERVVHVWLDHFNTFTGEGAMPLEIFPKIDHENAIREKAMQRFSNVLAASVGSPAFLYYLDNTTNRRENPNENFARELMELHTLGIDGGYTEQDVRELSRCLTGWTANIQTGRFQFIPGWHDAGDKVLLGQPITGSADMQDGIDALNILVQHPSTAHTISYRLVRHFVADHPPPSLVTAVAQVFMETRGDIRSMLRLIFASDEFWNAPPKFKRPLELVASAIRAVGLDYTPEQADNLLNFTAWSLMHMGQFSYYWLAPNGYPDTGTFWINNLLPRWQFLTGLIMDDRTGAPNFVQLIGRGAASSANLRMPAQIFFKRDLTTEEIARFETIVRDEPEGLRRYYLELLSLLMSPAFQYK